MADFANFATTAGRAFGSEQQVTSMLRHMSQEQEAFADGGNDLVGVVETWIDADATRLGQELTTGKLFEELNTLAADCSLGFPFVSAAVFGKELKMGDTPVGHRFVMCVRDGRSGSRVVAFRPATEPVDDDGLEVVEKDAREGPEIGEGYCSRVVVEEDLLSPSKKM